MFKNLQIFKFLDGGVITIEDLQLFLERQSFNPCQKFELESIGWVMPIGYNTGKLVQAVNDCLFFSLKKQERLLPVKVIKERLDDKIIDIELNQNRKVCSREKRALKDDIIHELTPRAFTSSTIINAYIDTQNGWLVIDSATLKKAEEVVSFLRHTVGSLPVTPFKFNDDISTVLTGMVENQRKNTTFEVLDDCVMLDNNGSKATCKQQNMFSSEVESHINAGKRVQRLKLEYADSTHFSVDVSFAIKQLKLIGLFEDQLNEVDAEDQLNEVDAEDEYQKFLADNTIMIHSITTLVNGLIELFGGENKEVYENLK